MKLNEIMTKNVQCISPDSSLVDAAKMMQKLDVGALPVCDNDRLAGMVTDRDIVTRSLAEGRTPSEARVKDVMTHPIHYCFDDQEVSEAVQTMENQQIRRLVVLDRNRKLCGIVSIGDLALHSGDLNMTGRVTSRVSEPKSQRPEEVVAA